MIIPSNGSDPGSKNPAGIGIQLKSSWDDPPGGVVKTSMPGLINEHGTAVPEQTPPVQTSLCVQALPSSQAVPSGAVGFEHMPVPRSQVPAT